LLVTIRWMAGSQVRRGRWLSSKIGPIRTASCLRVVIALAQAGVDAADPLPVGLATLRYRSMRFARPESAGASG
jgi:hypothetical protein